MSHVLLVETAAGDVVAVRFPTAAAARDWQDQHDDQLTAVGCPRVVTRAEALRLAR